MLEGQLEERVAKLISPAILFGPDPQPLGGINAELRDFLNSHGCNLQQNSSKKIVNTLARESYGEADEREAVIKIAKATIAAKKRASAALWPPPDPDPNTRSVSFHAE